MQNKELYSKFRSQIKYSKFGDFLENVNEFLSEKEKTCKFCTYHCGNSWCEVLCEEEIEVEDEVIKQDIDL